MRRSCRPRMTFLSMSSDRPCITRSLISAAALSVKVMATAWSIWSWFRSRSLSRARYRSLSARVFPDPAEAERCTDRAVSAALFIVWFLWLEAISSHIVQLSCFLGTSVLCRAMHARVSSAVLHCSYGPGSTSACGPCCFELIDGSASMAACRTHGYRSRAARGAGSTKLPEPPASLGASSAFRHVGTR